MSLNKAKHPYGNTFNVDSLSVNKDTGLLGNLIVNGSATFSVINASSFVLKSGTNLQFLKADGSVDSSTYIPAFSPTITTPVIDTINASSIGAATSIHPTVTTGSITLGAGLTTGALNIATVGTGITPISIGHTNSTIGLTGAVTVTGSLGATSLGVTNALQASTGSFTGSSLSINGASPLIWSTNASTATLFNVNTTSIVIGASTIKTTLYPSTGTATTSAQQAGYIGMPQNTQVASGAFTYTVGSQDSGKHLYYTGTPTSVTVTIPANTTTAFEIGTTIVIMNDLGNATGISIVITTDTMQLAGTGTTGTRTLARYGVASITKVTATKWIISGNGIA